MINIFDNIKRKYIGSRLLPIQEGEDLLYSENEIVGVSDGICLDENGNYFYEVIKPEIIEELPEAPKEIIEFINELKTKYKI